jgi:cytoskeletal protein CcmA (bactofilin family)
MLKGLAIIPMEGRNMLGKWKLSSRNHLGKGLRIVGDILGVGDLVCDGEIEGRIQLDGSLRIAPNAKIRGCIEAKEAEIAGHVEGDVLTRGRLTLRPPCQIKGDLVSAELEVEPGASVEGQVSIARQDIEPAPEPQCAPSGLSFEGR